MFSTRYIGGFWERTCTCYRQLQIVRVALKERVAACGGHCTTNNSSEKCRLLGIVYPHLRKCIKLLKPLPSNAENGWSSSAKNSIIFFFATASLFPFVLSLLLKDIQRLLAWPRLCGFTSFSSRPIAFSCFFASLFKLDILGWCLKWFTQLVAPNVFWSCSSTAYPVLDSFY